MSVEAWIPQTFDFLAELASFLKEGEVVVLVEIFYEPCQPSSRNRMDASLGGKAYAVNCKGEKEQVSLAEIYGKAARLGQVDGRCDC